MGFSLKGTPQVIINRALVISGIIEQYVNIVGTITQNKDKKITFNLNNNGKKKLIIIIDNPSWITYKIGRKKAEGVLLNRINIIPLLEALNGVDDE